MLTVELSTEAGRRKEAERKEVMLGSAGGRRRPVEVRRDSSLTPWFDFQTLRQVASCQRTNRPSGLVKYETNTARARYTIFVVG
ncbi:unnamed protein product [Protopolystoma xenopodis]|uniref:Uncharacterized protein n=1 Tax=Protopolystoma xenopodis TaxID=117903 RepID=A0A3S5BKV5_9PLAT|nr:unnamed protein product [Protopolystoma xenopodis]